METKVFNITFVANFKAGFFNMEYIDQGTGVLFLYDKKINGFLRLPNANTEKIVSGEILTTDDKKLDICLTIQGAQDITWPITFKFDLLKDPIEADPVRIQGGTVVMKLFPCEGVDKMGTK